MSVRKISAALAAEINKYGDGKVHMGLVTPTVPPPPPPEITAAELRRRRRRKMQGRQIARQVTGSRNNPTLIFTTTEFELANVIDGLTITFEHDQPQTMVDFSVVLSFSASPELVKFALNIDGLVDTSQTVEITSVATIATQYAGFFVPNVGPGIHRYQLAIAVGASVTATLTARQRQLRVAGFLAPG